MNPIAFVDTEIEPESGRVLDIGCVKVNGSQFHSNSVVDFIDFLKGSNYVCGHNLLQHDLKYIGNAVSDAGINSLNFIDTLYISPILFPCRPYHALVKDDKLETEDTNNPLNDSLKTRDLFYDEVAVFWRLDNSLKEIFYYLLNDKREFGAFFRFICYAASVTDIAKTIRDKFHTQICEEANLIEIIREHPVELAYCLALINAGCLYSITPPWVLKNYPAVQHVMHLLRSKPCLRGCEYCSEALDIYKGLKRFFGFESYRKYAGEPLQERAVNAAVAGKSLLAVFPTGGGKSITFQIPALMSGINSKGLTVVISPLQSLMKDQVDNLERVGITEAVTINGLLDPIERANSFERVENGSAAILYISPESLRSKTIEKLLLGRNVMRFVIDEAHCFSAWGQEFRVDYLYIGDFIREYQEKKNLQEGIPVSCFTATAKQKVIEDIKEYFRIKLSLELEVFSSGASRTNLHYKVFQKETKEDKYNVMRDLIEEKNCPTIIYVSRTKRAADLAQRLTQDGYKAKPYHGKMESREKTANQDAFIRGEVQIMVATSAFGMGVDKKDVGLVLHFDISDSLENYIQEAGRAGRDEKISADCYVLYNDEDLNKHFMLLNQNKLSIQEIQQVWKAVKDITRFRSKVSQSALEIARKAGWHDSIMDIETKVKTAIAALEESGYLKRGQNMPRVYADSILARNAQEAISKIDKSQRFDEKQKVQAVRIIKKLISSRSRKHLGDDAAEARVDYISDHLGIDKYEVIQIINLLREEGILADAKDLTAFIRKKENKNRTLNSLKSFIRIENFLQTIVEQEEKTFHIKELNEQAGSSGCTDVTPNMLKTVLNFWAIKNLIKKQTSYNSINHIVIMGLYERSILKAKLEKRHELVRFILEYLYDKSIMNARENDSNNEEILVEFSVLELKREFESRLTFFNTKVSIEDVEDAIFYLSRIDALKIEGGFMVVYNGLTIERLEQDNKKRYKAEDYQKLHQFYENKIQQIHIVGEYARKMITDYKAALQFVDDYFQLNYSSFLNKYFKGSRLEEIRKNITPAKFKQLFGELSPTQLKIINDKESKYIVVAAGPGSGKTRVLVHKLASLLLMEDIKHEQLLMLTFSRSSATEFKKRLIKLIGNAANFVEIKTFHSYCFDLLGRVGTLEKSAEIVKETVRRIKNGEVEAGRITKTVLVIDEAQDMDADEFSLITALMDQNEEMRVIAVGDDDQNIFEFRGASAKYLLQLISEKNAVMYEMVENYRSKTNLVDFSNKFITRLLKRMKSTPVLAVQKDSGEIRLIRYRSSNLVTPLVNSILTAELSGSTCVLCKTNEEALQVTGLLLKSGMQAKLIQTNEGFSLYNLAEVRYFLEQLHMSDVGYIISDDTWEVARRNLSQRFAGSTNLEICSNIIRDFEAVNTKNKYKTDLEIFIRESQLEDFYGENVETIFVSTIHKAKGREFDNVFLLLDRFYPGCMGWPLTQSTASPDSDEAIRQLYVALTRAKRNLSIHYNGSYLESIRVDKLEKEYDGAVYLQPEQLAMQLGYKDVWLDHFLYCQRLIAELKGGDEMAVDGDGCVNVRGKQVLKFSRQFISKVEYMKQRGYVPRTAVVNFVVYWQKEGEESETGIVLPQVYFVRE